MKMKRNLDLQLFAEEASAAGTQTDTAEKSNGAATDQNKATESAKATDEKKYSDADLDRIINKKFAAWQEKKQKEVEEAEKLAKMSEQEKAKYERDEVKKELEALKKEKALAEMSKTARKLLTEKNITVSDELLSMMVTTDATETKTAIDSFAKLFTDAVESAVKERLKGEPPKKGTGGAPSMTKEAIMAIKDPELRQQKMLENKHLFNF
jgi:hypothetical protein